jgi:hypothetical protein
MNNRSTHQWAKTMIAIEIPVTQQSRVVSIPLIALSNPSIFPEKQANDQTCQ